MAWGIEPATNPSIVRVHVAHELTAETIVTGPPAVLPMPVGGLLEIKAIRTIDVHRYRMRLNLRPGADRIVAATHARDVLVPAWGEPIAIGPDEGPHAFEVARRGPRLVAESAAMAAGDLLLEALFRVDGVSEAIAGDGVVLVRLGRLFAWEERRDAVLDALRSANDG